MLASDHSIVPVPPAGQPCPPPDLTRDDNGHHLPLRYPCGSAGSEQRRPSIWLRGRWGTTTPSLNRGFARTDSFVYS